MKKIILFILLTAFFFNLKAQEGVNLEVDAPKIFFGINIPFGVSMYIPNIYKKFGMYGTGFYNGETGIDDKNYISPWHELNSDYIISKQAISIGVTYRIWKPLQCYIGLGAGWGTRQLIYKDQPPHVLADAHRTLPSGVQPQFNAGLLLSYWRLAVGYGYDSYIQQPVFFIGYVIKVRK